MSCQKSFLESFLLHAIHINSLPRSYMILAQELVSPAIPTSHIRLYKNKATPVGLSSRSPTAAKDFTWAHKGMW